MVDCINNLQSLIKSGLDVSNINAYDEIYQKAADLVTPESEEIGMLVMYNFKQCVLNFQQKCPRKKSLLTIFGQCDFAVKLTIF